jgi:hypothetical protein
MTTLSYYIKFRPFSTAHIHRMEVINELTLLSCLYTCFLFTDYQPEDNLLIDRSELGWFLITLILINLAINFIGIFSIIGKFIMVLYRKAKAIYHILKNLWK